MAKLTGLSAEVADMFRSINARNGGFDSPGGEFYDISGFGSEMRTVSDMYQKGFSDYKSLNEFLRFYADKKGISVKPDERAADIIGSDLKIKARNNSEYFSDTQAAIDYAKQLGKQIKNESIDHTLYPKVVDALCALAYHDYKSEGIQDKLSRLQELYPTLMRFSTDTNNNYFPELITIPNDMKFMGDVAQTQFLVRNGTQVARHSIKGLSLNDLKISDFETIDTMLGQVQSAFIMDAVRRQTLGNSPIAPRVIEEYKDFLCEKVYNERGQVSREKPKDVINHINGASLKIREHLTAIGKIKDGFYVNDFFNSCIKHGVLARNLNDEEFYSRIADVSEELCNIPNRNYKVEDNSANQMFYFKDAEGKNIVLHKPLFDHIAKELNIAELSTSTPLTEVEAVLKKGIEPEIHKALLERYELEVPTNVSFRDIENKTSVMVKKADFSTRRALGLMEEDRILQEEQRQCNIRASQDTSYTTYPLYMASLAHSRSVIANYLKTFREDMLKAMGQNQSGQQQEAPNGQQQGGQSQDQGQGAGQDQDQSGQDQDQGGQDQDQSGQDQDQGAGQDKNQGGQQQGTPAPAQPQGTPAPAQPQGTPSGSPYPRLYDRVKEVLKNSFNEEGLYDCDVPYIPWIEDATADNGQSQGGQPQGKPTPAQPQGGQQQGTPAPAQPQGTPAPAQPQGTPAPAHPQGGQPKPLTFDERMASIDTSKSEFYSEPYAQKRHVSFVLEYAQRGKPIEDVSESFFKILEKEGDYPREGASESDLYFLGSLISFSYKNCSKDSDKEEQRIAEKLLEKSYCGFSDAIMANPDKPIGELISNYEEKLRDPNFYEKLRSEIVQAEDATADNGAGADQGAEQ